MKLRKVLEELTLDSLTIKELRRPRCKEHPEQTLEAGGTGRD